MNNRLLAGLAAAGLIAGGGSATALTTAAPAAAVSTTAVASSTSKAPDCGPLGPLVAKGTITQAQAIAIHKAFVSYFHDHWRSILDTVLGQEVKNHTISKAQATAVANAITHFTQSHRASASSHHVICHHGGMMGKSGNK